MSSPVADAWRDLGGWLGQTPGNALLSPQQVTDKMRELERDSQ